MRSGWGDDDLYFSLLAAGRATTELHVHQDGGHFCLFAHNEAFSIDSGYGDLPARHHSVMVPNADELRTERDWHAVGIEGRVCAFGVGKRADYACVDISAHWDCCYAFRHALLIKAPGAYPYVVLLDNYNYRSQWSTYLWLMNSEPGNKIELNAEQERAVVHGRQHRLEVAWSYPQAADYPVEHRIEIDADQIDSRPPFQHMVEDVVDYFTGLSGKRRPHDNGRWGAGIRPRLKTMLYGYNGQLMTALVPRRAQEPTVEARRIGAMGQFGLVVKHGEVTDTILSSQTDRHMDIEGLRGDATLAVVRRDRGDKLLWWAAADAYVLQIDGAQVLPRRAEAVTLAEGTSAAS